jgi:uncharacterized protein
VYISSPDVKSRDQADLSIGRIVSVTGSKAIVLLDDKRKMRDPNAGRPEMGTLLAVDTNNSVVLGLVSALSVPVPAQKEEDPEVWIAELGLVGEIPKAIEGKPGNFQRGVTAYPALGDRVRVASKAELHRAFTTDAETSVRVGVIRQDSTIPAMIKTDDMLGKHFAILGTTGTGKSCTTALILRNILEVNPQAHIVLLDPHNEYATSFGDKAEVITPHNMHLPYWLLTFEELVEVLIGNPEDRKQEIEILIELIPACKGKFGTKQGGNERGPALKRSSNIMSRFTVDTPVPYRMSDLIGMLDDKMGMLENKRDLSPYRWLKARIDLISQDPRYAFMFGGFTVNDSMASILGRLFRIPVNGKPITILELTGLPTEIVNVVVSVLCRMTFDFALWGEGHVPVTLVCEEAHRYVPVNSASGFEPAKRAIAKIAKEGRKYGASLCIVTQRPAEIDPTILSQCNTVFALRMSNDRDQAIVQSAIADTGSGLLEFLPALGSREAIAFGDGMTLPVRIKFDELPKHALPRSSTARFSEKWNMTVGDDNFLQTVVERWRASGSPHAVVVEEALAMEAAEASKLAPAMQMPMEMAPPPRQVAPSAQPQLQQPMHQPAPQPMQPHMQQPMMQPPLAAQRQAQPQAYNVPPAAPVGMQQQGYYAPPQTAYPAQAPAYAQQMPPGYQQAPSAYGMDPNQMRQQPQQQPPQAMMQPARQQLVPTQEPRQSLLRKPQVEINAAAPRGAEVPAPAPVAKRPGGLGGLLRRREQ